MLYARLQGAGGVCNAWLPKHQTFHSFAPRRLIDRKARIMDLRFWLPRFRFCGGEMDGSRAKRTTSLSDSQLHSSRASALAMQREPHTKGKIGRVLDHVLPFFCRVELLPRLCTPARQHASTPARGSHALKFLLMTKMKREKSKEI